MDKSTGLACQQHGSIDKGRLHGERQLCRKAHREWDVADRAEAHQEERDQEEGVAVVDVVHSLVHDRQEDAVEKAENDRGRLVCTRPIHQRTDHDRPNDPRKEQVEAHHGDLLRTEAEGREYTGDEVAEANIEAEHEGEAEAEQHKRRVFLHDLESFAELHVLDGCLSDRRGWLLRFVAENELEAGKNDGEDDTLRLEQFV